MVLLIVLAGGKSTRFGRDKCTYVLGGKKMVEYVVEAGLHVAREVYIAAGSNAHLYEGWKVIQDSIRFSGPLAGIDAAVQTFDEELLFAPCDTPFLKPSVFQILASVDAPAAVWVFPNGRVESTIFKARPREIRDALDIMSAHRRSRIDDVFRLVDTAFLSMEKHGVDPRWFINLNRPEDLYATYQISSGVFVEDQMLRWEEPPLAMWLAQKNVEALKIEFIRYVELGLFSLAAHVAKDISTAVKSFGVLADLLYGAVAIEKS